MALMWSIPKNPSPNDFWNVGSAMLAFGLGGYLAGDQSKANCRSQARRVGRPQDSQREWTQYLVESDCRPQYTSSLAQRRCYSCAPTTRRLISDTVEIRIFLGSCRVDRQNAVDSAHGKRRSQLAASCADAGCNQHDRGRSIPARQPRSVDVWLTPSRRRLVRSNAPLRGGGVEVFVTASL